MTRPDPDEQQVAAAVCYRRTDNTVEFLLVPTKGGSRWTFPKGHVKRKEQPWEAAAREAEEEAGIEGDIQRTPFVHYLYPDTRSNEADPAPLSVAAFLLAVESERRPDERFRKPQWFTPQQAVAKLVERRESPYAEEHVRVIRTALDALGVSPVGVELSR